MSIWSHSVGAGLVLAACVVQGRLGWTQESTVAPVKAPRGRALVLGNGSYRALQPVGTAARDAQLVAAALRELGFDVMETVDTDRNGLDGAVNGFLGTLRPGDAALFFYAGHGLQFEGENYLIPVDFDPAEDETLSARAYAVSRVAGLMARRGASPCILILDASRREPGLLRHASGEGLAAPSDPRERLLISFSTVPNRSASDVPGRANGLFAEALVATIRKPGLSLSQVFSEVQVAVNEASGGQQTPSTTSIIVKPFFFRDPLPKPAEPPKPDLPKPALRQPEPAGPDLLKPAPRQPEPARPPDGLNPGEVRVNPLDQLSYVWIPPGEFRMGCSPGDDECSDNERTAHAVTVARGFWMGQTEVTVAAYKRIASRGGGALPPGNGGDGQPVVNVTWDDAVAYCRDTGGRLPTEAEWEYAARAGTAGARHGELEAIAWHRGNSDGNIHPARQKAPNGFRLYDMLGGVWEWVADWYGAKYYDASPPADPQGPAEGEFRVVRGGSWINLPRFLRASGRGGGRPGFRDYSRGFRCARETAP